MRLKDAASCPYRRLAWSGRLLQDAIHGVQVHPGRLIKAQEGACPTVGDRVPSRPLRNALDDLVNYKAGQYDGYEPYGPKDRPGKLLGCLSVLFRFISHVITSPK